MSVMQGRTSQENFLMERSAILDESGRYRLLLTRRWARGPSVTWIMLNPSTADGDVDDPTILRCIEFSTRWGYSGLQVVNVFAYRATDPAALMRTEQPIGPWSEFKRLFESALLEGSLTIAAWGAYKARSGDWKEHVDSLMREHCDRGHTIFCLGETANGSPKHPLYLAGGTRLQVYR